MKKFCIFSLMAALIISGLSISAQVPLVKPIPKPKTTKTTTSKDSGPKGKSGSTGKNGNTVNASNTVSKSSSNNSSDDNHGSQNENYKLYYDKTTNEIVYGSNRYKMVEVFGGSFTMGATSEQSNGYNPDGNEMPAHNVVLSTYRIGATEVPQWLWVAVMGTNPSKFKGDNLPVETVSWNDCMEFISRLNVITNMDFRLPTEAEWEYAARGAKSEGTIFSGSDNIFDVAWFRDNCGRSTHEVGTKRPNSLGLYDMTGNVREWCADWYDKDYYSNSPKTNPLGPSSSWGHVSRGGAYYSEAKECRVAKRNGLQGEGTSSDGLQLAVVTPISGEARQAEEAYRAQEARKAEERRNVAEDNRRSGFYFNESSNEIIYGNHRYKLVKMPEGQFRMGATLEQVSQLISEHERPTHDVTLSSYRIGATEVPQWLWVAVMGTNPSEWKGDNLPVENVSWSDCMEFINRLNMMTNMNFRLPTEAEWEYAARGGKSEGTIFSGSDKLKDVSWFKKNSKEKTHEVGAKMPNSVDLYDMSGNVCEWCADWYNAKYYSISPMTNPKGPSTGTERVVRGGCWGDFEYNCRVSSRYYTSPGRRAGWLGLRLVL